MHVSTESPLLGDPGRVEVQRSVFSDERTLYSHLSTADSSSLVLDLHRITNPPEISATVLQMKDHSLLDGVLTTPAIVESKALPVANSLLSSPQKPSSKALVGDLFSQEKIKSVGNDQSQFQRSHSNLKAVSTAKQTSAASNEPIITDLPFHSIGDDMKPLYRSDSSPIAQAPGISSHPSMFHIPQVPGLSYSGGTDSRNTLSTQGPLSGLWASRTRTQDQKTPNPLLSIPTGSHESLYSVTTVTSTSVESSPNQLNAGFASHSTSFKSATLFPSFKQDPDNESSNHSVSRTTGPSKPATAEPSSGNDPSFTGNDATHRLKRRSLGVVLGCVAGSGIIVCAIFFLHRPCYAWMRKSKVGRPPAVGNAVTPRDDAASLAHLSGYQEISRFSMDS